MDQVADGHHRRLWGGLGSKGSPVNLNPVACTIVVALGAVSPENATGTGFLSMQCVVFFAVSLGGFETFQLGQVGQFVLVLVETEWTEVVAKFHRGATDDFGRFHVFLNPFLNELRVALGAAVHLARELGLMPVMRVGAVLIRPRDLGLDGRSTRSSHERHGLWIWMVCGVVQNIYGL